MKQEETVLEVLGLNAGVRTADGVQPILRDIGFELKSGRILGLIGESGSGKTMTCMSLLQLMNPDTTAVEGSICLHGRELNGMKPAEMRRIRGKELSFIMQNPMNAFSPVFTIGHQFIETIRTHTRLSKREAHQLAVDCLADVHLPDPDRLMHQYPFELSGGMLQRVMIAMAMSLGPSVLIADEPTTALDCANQLQVLRLLDRVRSQHGTAILLISHDLGVIAELADEVIVMRHGQIVERADVFALFDAPQHPYTRELLDARIPLPVQDEQAGSRELLRL